MQIFIQILYLLNFAQLYSILVVKLKGSFSNFYNVHIINHRYFKIIIYYLYCLSQYIVKNISFYINILLGIKISNAL